MSCATLSLFRFGSIMDRLWVMGQMATARFELPKTPGIGFFKLCGSGTGEGFTPIPNTAVWAIIADWPDEATARKSVAEAPVYRKWTERAEECWTIFLEPLAARGRWGGVAPFVTTQPHGGCPWSQIGADQGPIAAMTRASLRPGRAMRFWKAVPTISQVIGADPNIVFKIGVGEVPMLHQVTFSIWPDTTSMAAFANKDGPHARAIKAVRDEKWFSEDLYVRFRILGNTGTWEGKNPLAALETAA